MPSTTGAPRASTPPPMRFVDRDEVAARFRGKRVAVVGSAPTCLDNAPGFIDAHDLVVRVNNYKTRGFERQVGARTDVHYSFYGSSVRKSAAELAADGVMLCMAKCPDARPIESAWHVARAKHAGIDFRYIYRNRRDWWFCDTYVPTVERFRESFAVLGNHIPTTGFAALYEICDFDCSVYVTGFDFFASGVHNVDEAWRPGAPDDPIGHVPAREAQWLARAARAEPDRITLDPSLRDLLL